MGRCTDRRDMTKAVESGVKLQTNKQTNKYSGDQLRAILALLLEIFPIMFSALCVVMHESLNPLPLTINLQQTTLELSSPKYRKSL